MNPNPPTPPQIRVLLIEDDEVDAELVKRFLQKAGNGSYHVDWVQYLSQGLERLDSRDFDIIVTDLNLPDFFGNEIIDQLCEVNPNLPIVVVTGYAKQEDYIVEGLNKGIQDYLIKDHLTKEWLVSCIRGAIQRKKVQVELELTRRDLDVSQKNISKLVDENADGIIVIDKNGMIRYANPAFERFFGRSAKELVGEPFGLPLIQGGSTEIELIGAGGQIFVVDMRMVETSWQEDGKVEDAYLATVRDITLRKLNEDKLRQQKKELENKNQELEQFAYISSHDLQEPLRKVQAFGDRLVTKYGDRLDDQGRDYLQRMTSASARMQVLINNLLDLSRVTSRAKPFEATDLKEIVESVVSDLELQISREFGAVQLGDLHTIDADPTQIRQLFQNLIGNALKFHIPGESIHVKVSSKIGEDTASQKSQACEIIVKDNGIGFDSKHADRIFQPFQRLHGRISYEGTGIGLSICRKIVDRHNGKISVESQEGEGSKFVVTLPVKQVGEDEATR